MSTEQPPAAELLHTDRPNAARVYDFLLGGTHSYAADRQFAAELAEALPSIGEIARLNRAWLHRAVEFGVLSGIHQFLDLGSGLPTAEHVHEIALRHRSDARVVYVDNEPVALAHGRALLADLPRTAIVDADLEDPARVLNHPTTRLLLDFDQPIMVLMSAVLHFIPDERDPAALVAGYRSALAPGSLVAVSHVTGDRQPEPTRRAAQLYLRTDNPLHPRSRNELAAIMGDLDILDPGIVFIPEWHPATDDDVAAHPEEAVALALVGRKTAGEQVPPGVDITKPHSARIWNYWLGGKDHYAVDREFGDRVNAVMPGRDTAAQVSRAFLQRAVRHLVAERGVRQFLDCGTGLPTADNTHDIAQAAAPECHIVYVDNDPLVLAHARALLTSTPEGATNFVAADLREPHTVTAQAAELLDLTRPVGLILGGILGHLADQQRALRIVGHLLGALPPGSFLVWYDGVLFHDTPENRGLFDSYNDADTQTYLGRTREQVEELFAGLEILPPGIVLCPQWRPTLTTVSDDNTVQYCAVARKP